MAIVNFRDLPEETQKTFEKIRQGLTDKKSEAEFPTSKREQMNES